MCLYFAVLAQICLINMMVMYKGFLVHSSCAKIKSMAYRAMDVLRCKNCNAGARFIFLPTANKPFESPVLLRDGTINGKLVECPVREGNRCTPPDMEAYDPVLAEDGIAFGEVQILAAMTGLKFDADCQKTIRVATLGCIFCIVKLGQAILACAEPCKFAPS